MFTKFMQELKKCLTCKLAMPVSLFSQYFFAEMWILFIYLYQATRPIEQKHKKTKEQTEIQTERKHTIY